MTTTEASLVLRRPWWVKGVLAAFGCTFLHAAFVHAPLHGGFSPEGAILSVVAVAFATRLATPAVTGTADGRLTVRNVWSTRTFRRDEVASISVERPDEGMFGHRMSWVVHLWLTDGTRHRLDVLETASSRPFRRRLDQRVDAVRAWLDGRPQPFL